jgi:hypothetical protein
MPTHAPWDNGIALLRARPGVMVRIIDELGISGAAVYKWKTVPPRRVREVARIAHVAAYRLRPDMYPPPKRLRITKTAKRLNGKNRHCQRVSTKGRQQ